MQKCSDLDLGKHFAPRLDSNHQYDRWVGSATEAKMKTGFYFATEGDRTRDLLKHLREQNH